jgi:hypothetical protein
MRWLQRSGALRTVQHKAPLPRRGTDRGRPQVPGDRRTMHNRAYPPNVRKTDAGQCLSRCATQGRSVTVTNRRQPNPGVPPHSARRQVRRRPAASVEMWQSNAAPVGTPHAVNASPSYSLTSNGPGTLRASAKACAKPTRPMNHFPRRKSLPGKAIHRPRPRGRHPSSHGQYVTVTQCSAPAGYQSRPGAMTRSSCVHLRNQHSHWRKRNPLSKSKCPLRCHERVSSACKPFG